MQNQQCRCLWNRGTAASCCETALQTCQQQFQLKCHNITCISRDIIKLANIQRYFKYANCEYKDEYEYLRVEYKYKYWHRAMFSGMPKTNLNSRLHETVDELLKCLWSCFIHFIWDHFSPCCHHTCVSKRWVLKRDSWTSQRPCFAGKFQLTTSRLAMHSSMTITPRPLH